MSGNEKLEYNEQERLKALRDYQILDTPQESQFDNLCKLAALICNVSGALIVLIDNERLWIKSSFGLTCHNKEVPRNFTFSERVIAGNELLEIQDTHLSEEFSGHPLVLDDPYIRFYAGAPLKDEHGFNLGVIGVYDTEPKRLTTEQKEALITLSKEVITHLSLRKRNLELQMNSKKFEELIAMSSVSPEIHCILDFNGKILFINDAVTQLLGYSVEEALDVNIWELCHRDDVNRVVSAIEQGLRAHKKEFFLDFRVVSRTGIIRWLSWSIVTKDKRWYTYGRDVTESKRVENELMKLSFVASKVNNAIVINDPNNHVTWVNEAFEKITGFTLDDLKGRRLGDLLTGPDTDVELMERARALNRKNQSFTVDLLVYRKDKKPIWLSIYNTVVFNDEGGVSSEVEIIIDITEKKKVESELMKAKEEALQLGEAKEMFLSVMSHEIRTPLNAIIGITNLLLENEPKASQLNDLNILKFSGENLLNIINDILDFTKIESGNLELESIPFSLNVLVNDIVNSLKTNVKEKGNHLNLSYDPAIPNEILGDKTRLYQILMNLLGNANKFTEKGEIELHIKLEKEDDGKVLLAFAVKDTGIGIPKDKQGYIFESFTQAKTDISRKYGGTGLGLAITKRLLKMYHSDIYVESTEGTGTVFSFEITFSKFSTIASASSGDYLPPAIKEKRILVVDDNEINVFIAKRILGKMGLDVDAVSTGREAIARVKDTRYDLIFMDIRMPDIDGYETTALIRGQEGRYFKTVPVIALTASVMGDDVERIDSSGMNGYLLKPFSLDDIKLLFQKIFGQ